jgi:hypothetical protein
MVKTLRVTKISNWFAKGVSGDRLSMLLDVNNRLDN